MPGVVSLCEGIEPDLGADGVDIAGAANVLTSDEPTLPSRGATMHSTFVEVRLSEAPATANSAVTASAGRARSPAIDESSPAPR